MSRGEGAIGAMGLQVERRVQDIVHELGRALMREAFEIADTTASAWPTPRRPRN